jgi:hypothetical protein
VAFRNRNAQRGMGLILLLVVVVLAFTYVLMSRLPLATRQTAAKREYNAKVLNQAKQALIGKMVIDAAGTDNNPGRLRCPEGPNNIGTDQEGVAAPDPGDPTCATVGRLPWRTLGLDKLVDADAEPLWYAVSPGWALQNTLTTLTINSDKRGQMTVDGQAPPNDVVALIIAPGRAMNVQAAPGCTARTQARAAPAPTINAADYIECFNAATPAFSTVGPTTSFNDQVLTVTTADLIPPLEAAIQQRMQREIAPVLRTVYSSAAWGQTAANPVYPFAARFDNPHPGTDTYQGEDGRYQGLLPVTSSSPSCGADPRCSTTFVNYNTPTIAITSGGTILTSNCSLNSGVASCDGLFLSVVTANFRMTVRANNVAMALRSYTPVIPTIESGLLTVGLGSPQPGTSGTPSFNSNGSVDFTFQGNAPGVLGLTLMYRFTADLSGMLRDHPLLDPDSTGAGSTGWFMRNEWYRLVWYGVAPMNTVDNLTGSPPVPIGCVNNPPTTTNCLRINGTRNIRALLVVAGRSLSNPAGRPNSNLMDYLEHANCNRTFVFPSFVCTPGPSFEQRAMRTDKVVLGPAFAPPFNAPFYAPFNDRVVLVDWIAPAPTFPLATLLP